MNHRYSAAAFAIASLSIAVLQGCDSVPWVSQEEYLDTALAHHNAPPYASDTSIYGYTPPPMDATIDDRPLSTPRTESSPEIVIRNTLPYSIVMRDDLDSLQRDLDRILAKANVKGAAALAAVDPKVREFDMYRRNIEDRLGYGGAVGDDDWRERTMRNDFDLDHARRAVAEASNVVNSTPATQNPPTPPGG